MNNFSKVKFQRNSSQPLYVQVANWMQGRIITGEWPSGYKLPPEVELAGRFGISRGTLRQAISLLIARRMIEQAQGKGTFVGKAVFEQNWAYKLVSTSEELNWLGIPFDTRVLDLKKKFIHEERVLQKLGIGEPRAAVVYLKRLRLVDGIPVVLHETFFPIEPYQGLLEIDFTQCAMTATLEKTLKVKLFYADHSISAMYAEKEISELLGIQMGEPVIYNEHVMVDASEQAVEFTKAWFRGDRFRLKTRVFREAPAASAQDEAY
jgi:DNA-binding GntR family transcriptional regulator